MKNTTKIAFFSLVLIGILTSCRNRKIILPDLPYLVADSVMVFKVGDRFILATSVNSCCQYLWIDKFGIEYDIPETDLIKNVETISDEADPDCAGCSSYTYRIYECTKPGNDSLVYAVIPAGDTDFFEGLSQFSESDAPKKINQSDIIQHISELKENNYLRVYKFVIQN